MLSCRQQDTVQLAQQQSLVSSESVSDLLLSFFLLNYHCSPAVDRPDTEVNYVIILTVSDVPDVPVTACLLKDALCSCSDPEQISGSTDKVADKHSRTRTWLGLLPGLLMCLVVTGRSLQLLQQWLRLLYLQADRSCTLLDLCKLLLHCKLPGPDQLFPA